LASTSGVHGAYVNNRGEWRKVDNHVVVDSAQLIKHRVSFEARMSLEWATRVIATTGRKAKLVIDKDIVNG
jgi:hypothetical protein